MSTTVYFRKSEDALIAILPERTYEQQYRLAYLYERGKLSEVGVDMDLIVNHTEEATVEECREFKTRLENQLKTVLKVK